MSKERLEEIEVLLNEYYDNIEDPFATTDNAMAIVDKVGYFVNWVKELEEDKKALGDLNEATIKTAWDIKQQNKRYREAFRQIKLQILFEGTIECHRENIIEIIDEVMEGEE